VVVEHTQQEIDAALSKGARPYLPDNETPGWLGEVSPDLRKVDEFKPSLNAGLIQEETPQTKWLLMLVLYLLVITCPAAVWILWREPRRSLRAKIVTTVVGVIGYVALFFLMRNAPAA
jgi:Fe2+ transport system protein B